MKYLLKLQDGTSLGTWEGEDEEDAVKKMLAADPKWEELRQQMAAQRPPGPGMPELVGFSLQVFELDEDETDSGLPPGGVSGM